MIYLDNASTTRVDSEVLKEMLPYFSKDFGNPGTIYAFGRNAKFAVDHARSQVASFINAKPEQIIFTSGGTEANNMAFLSLVDHLKQIGKTNIIVSSVEHDSVLKAAKEMHIKHGFDITYLPVEKNGIIKTSSLISAINNKTGLVSIMSVNNETGSINPIKSIGNVCKANGIFFHTDCVQAAGTLTIDVDEIGCDLLSISSHKIFGPKGVGALYIRDPKIISPLILGGSNQEFGLRGGTENVPGIVGFGKACELAKYELKYHRVTDYLEELKTLFIETINQHLGSEIKLNGSRYVSDPKIVNIDFSNYGVDAETLVLLLDSKGVYVSSGSACRSLYSEPSHVLTAMGCSPDQARHSIRISFSRKTSLSEVIEAGKLIAESVKELSNEGV